MSTLYFVRPICVIAALVSGLSACSEERVAAPFKDASEAVEVDAGGGIDAAAEDAMVPDSGPGPNCDLNPSGCVDGQVRGPAPMCVCLMACLGGYSWDGTTCVPDAVPDAGQPDADPMGADATPMGVDADPMGADATPMGVDADPMGADAAPMGADAAPMGVDATPMGVDAAPINPDAAPVPGDAAVILDAGGNDAAVGLDAGGLDAMTPDSGFIPMGLFEGDPCNWQQANTCLQAPGMICQQLDPAVPTAGICLRTCDVAQNQVGGTLNAVCAGIGPNCVDIGLSPIGGRCLSAVGPYESLADVLDICDPTVANLVQVADDLCWPLCTVTPPTPPASQTPLTCSGRYGTCITEFAFNDGQGGVLAACGVRTTRSSTCTEGRGVHCQAADICVLGRCHQQIGTTCGAAACAVAGETCVEAGTAPNQVAFCQDPCTVFQPATCNGTDACELTGFGGNPSGSCRAVTGAIPALGDCSDSLDLGTQANDCVAGTTCLPIGATNDFTDAICVQLCSPSIAGAPACPAGLTCNAFGTPFQSFGVCL